MLAPAVFCHQVHRWLADPNEAPRPGTYKVLAAREFRYDEIRARYLAVDYATPGNSPGSRPIRGQPMWADYDGVILYADLSMRLEKQLRTLRRRRAMCALSYVVVFGIAFLCYRAQVADDTMVPVLVSLGLVWVVAHILVAVSRCPHRGARFFWYWGSTKYLFWPFARRCVNCGMPIRDN